MMQVSIAPSYVAAMAAFYLLSYFFYVRVSHGLGHKAEYLQLRRFIPCAILAVLPSALAGLALTGPLFMPAFLTGLGWILAYPLLYYLTNRAVSSDFGFHLDIVFGLYLIGWFTSFEVLILSASFLPETVVTVLLVLTGAVECLLLLVPILQFAYYAIYGTCVNEGAMMLLQETNYNEILEFLKSLPKRTLLVTSLLAVILLVTFCHANGTASRPLTVTPVSLVLCGITFVFLTVYFFFSRKPLFPRVGIVELYLNVRDYFRTTKLYAESRAELLRDLQVTPASPGFSKPSTFVLVIGESESRDYMKAFNDAYPVDTTPWLTRCRQDDHYILFPHAYASADQTVTSLERALTEFNQYDGDTRFYTSASIVDIAHKAGYRVYWYSNQGHLGAAETPVTLVANTSDVAKWTKQNLNQVQYDETLLTYLKEVPDGQNNFVVIHLKGSHFNFENRYPQSFTKFGTPGKYDLIPNYENTVAYTDYILQSIHDYAVEHLNLQGMLYFSDHGTIPDKRRSANFDGFATVRVPMFAWFSDEYRQRHPEVCETLQKQKDRYFTTDLAYELLCGIFAIRSNRFKEENCLASPRFKFTRDMLKTNQGRTWIKEDTIG
jgi:heptose-I-phosphate ethanolaminephosphotransferase